MSSQINGQVNRAINDANRAVTDAVNQANAEWNKFVQMANDTTVSYTHLTLPTIYSV